MSDDEKFVFDIPVAKAGKGKTRASKEQPKTKRKCAVKGCNRPGTHRAPKNRDNLREYYWFCVDHVREYNRNWNFFKNMSDGQVEDFLLDGLTGHRPTYPMGSNPYVSAGKAAENRMHDPYSIIDDGPGDNKVEVEKGARRPKVGKITADALAVLDLDDRATLNEVTARYKELVKRYHPDANGGDRGAEERLAKVIRAYKQIKNSGFA